MGFAGAGTHKTRFFGTAAPSTTIRHFAHSGRLARELWRTSLRVLQAADLVGRLSDGSDGHEEPEGLRRQRLKPIAAVQFQSLFDAFWIPAV